MPCTINRNEGEQAVIELPMTMTDAELLGLRGTKVFIDIREARHGDAKLAIDAPACLKIRRREDDLTDKAAPRASKLMRVIAIPCVGEPAENGKPLGNRSFRTPETAAAYYGISPDTVDFSIRTGKFIAKCRRSFAWEVTR